MSAPTPRRGGRRRPARAEGEEPKRGELMPLGDALAEFLRDSKLLQRKKQQPAYDAWDEAVGPEIARQARAVSFRRGELIVEVDSTSLLSELRGFAAEDLRTRADALLAEDPSAISRIRKLTFKLKRRR